MPHWKSHWSCFRLLFEAFLHTRPIGSSCVSCRPKAQQRELWASTEAIMTPAVLRHSYAARSFSMVHREARPQVPLGINRHHWTALESPSSRSIDTCDRRTKYFNRCRRPKQSSKLRASLCPQPFEQDRTDEAMSTRLFYNPKEVQPRRSPNSKVLNLQIKVVSCPSTNY